MIPKKALLAAIS